MQKPTEQQVQEMLTVAATAQELVTAENVVSIMRKLADDTERGEPELREVVARTFGIFLSATFELAAKVAIGMMAEDGTAAPSEEDDDGLD